MVRHGQICMTNLENIMKYYSSWQEALRDFVEHYGHNYKEVDEVYALMVEFELELQRNVKGAYYMQEKIK